MCVYLTSSAPTVYTILPHSHAIQARAGGIPDVLLLGAADILQCLLGYQASLRPTLPLGRDLSTTVHPLVPTGLSE